MIRTQTMIIGFCSLVVIIVMLTNAFIPSNKSITTLFDKSTVYVILFIVFFVLPFTLIKLYAVNCMLEGNCDVFVNILVGIAIAVTVSYVVMFLVKVIKQKRRAVVVAEEKSHN